MPFNRPTLTELLERSRSDIDARLPGADSRLRRSVLDVLARVHSATAAGLHGYLDWISKQVLPDTSDAEVLARQAAIWGIRRKSATIAMGEATLVGVNGSVVPIDARLARGDGVEYRVVAAAAIAGGTATVPIEAVAAGLAGNATFLQKLRFVSPVEGVSADAAIAAGDVSGGTDEEDDESLRARLLDRIRQPPHGGSLNDYQRWALEVPGVTRAWIYPEWLGPGTVGLTFVADGRADIIPTADEVAEVQAHIDPLRPVTAALTVFAPVPVPFGLAIRVTPATAAVKDAITAEIEDLLAREAVPGGTILISRIREAISQAAGEYDNELVRPLGNVEVAPGQLLVAGEIQWVGG